MKTLTKITLLTIVLIGIGLNVFAQVKSLKELKGDKYFFVYSFDKAINSYTHAKNLSVEGQRRLAKCYQNKNQNIKAEVAYSQLINTTGGNLPEDYYDYAMILKTDGKNDSANILMDKFAELKPGDLRAKDYEANKAGLADLSKDSGKYKIAHLNFNTDAEDFGACFYKNKIVFASTRTTKAHPKKYNWNGKPFIHIYVADVEQGQLKNPELFDKSISSKMHDGPASFNQDGTYMAFTSNNYDVKHKDKIINLEIYFTSFKDGKWTKPEPFILNNKTYSVGHPCLTSDGNTMYFTSDMPGGFGGTDIYKITKNGTGAWGKPENMGAKINTEGDEMFPFIDEPNKMLYFSSNGRFGLGGLDVFIGEMQGSEIVHVYNAGFPINTPYDDFALAINSKTNQGYFSSNRNGGSGDDDIYSFDIVPPGKQITGVAKDIDGKLLANTFVTLWDNKDSILDTVSTVSDGAYTFFVGANKNFKLTGTKENYFDGKSTASTFGNALIDTADVILLQKEAPVADKIKVGADLTIVLALDNAYFDFDKFNIRPDAAIDLDKVVKIMNDYPDMVIHLSSYADCRGTESYNQVLSDKRAKESAWYIKKRITNPERISGKGYGKTNLVNGCACGGEVVSTCSKDEHQLNRRTEFIVVNKINNKNLPVSSADQESPIR